MDNLKIQIDLNLDTSHDKYKFLFADDTEEIRRYRNNVMERGKFKGNLQGVYNTIEQAALKEFEREFIKAAKGNATITD